mmetsp:Transcript_29899/g.85800  ORF Transcript_29899/g.85800 Transcript_29899/m.85800 type:complete len:123 (-) Transcript_29899:142-510(-)
MLRAALRTPAAALRAQVTSRSFFAGSLARFGSHTGSVKFFNTEKGFGFVTSDADAQEYFVHYTAIQSSGFRSLAEGEKVEFDLETDDRKGGMRAANVTGPGGAQVQGAPRPEQRGGRDDFDF